MLVSISKEIASIRFQMNADLHPDMTIFATKIIENQVFVDCASENLYLLPFTCYPFGVMIQRYFSLILFALCLEALSIHAVFAQQRGKLFAPRFDRITTKQGLSNNSITCFLEDKQGFIWIGTHHGLNRYDGYACKSYYANPNSSSALVSDDIADLALDKQGNIWVATHNDGVARLNPRTEQFRTFRHNPSDPHSISSNETNGLCLDSSGTLWVSTYNAGLNRFDTASQSFRRVAAAFRGVLCPQGVCGLTGMCAGADGRLWFGADGGGVYHAAAQTQMQAVAANMALGAVQQAFQEVLPLETFAHNTHSTINMKANFITELAPEKRGNGLWAASWGGGLAKIDPVRGITTTVRMIAGVAALPNNTIRAVLCENDSVLWVGTWGSGLARYDMRRISQNTSRHNSSEAAWELFQHEASDNESLGGNFITMLFRDSQGRLWIGTENAGVSLLNPHKPQFTVIRANPAAVASGRGGLRDNMITALAPNSLKSQYLSGVGDISGRGVWIGTMNGGLHHLNLQNGMITVFPTNLATKNGISHRFIQALHEDRFGRLWIGNDSGGVSVLEIASKAHRNYATDYWRIRTNNPLQFHDTPGLVAAFAVQSSSKPLQDSLWIALTGSGLVQTSLSANVHEEFRHPANLYSPLERPNNTHFGSTRILSMLPDGANGFWLATDTAGLDHFHVPTRGVRHFRHNNSDSTSLSNDGVNCLHRARNGILWVGTQLGLNRFQPATQAFTRFTMRDGLPDNAIASIQEDASGRLWIGTNKGLCCLRFDGMRLAEVLHYDEHDGIADNEHTGAAFTAADGTMFFGTTGGLTIFHPDSIRPSGLAPSVVLTGFRKFNRPTRLDTAMPYLTTLPLSYTDNIFSIEFAALGFTTTAKQHYAYKLEGFDDNWVDAGTSREATYTNLRGGNYRFRVRAANADGLWSSTEATLAIAVTPPFWETAWFLGVMAVVVLASASALTYTLSRRRLREQVRELERQRSIDHARERERRRISADLHDEIGSGLTQISMLSDVMKRQLPKDAPVRGHIETIAATAQDVVRSVGNIVWALNPENDTLGNFLAYTREYAGGYFTGTGIAVRSAFPNLLADEIAECHVTATFRRNMFLVVKESLANIAKHAAKSRVVKFEVEFDAALKTLHLRIADDGGGMATTEGREFGNGLKTMRRRVEEMGGEFWITSAEGQGTEIRCRVGV
jgi:ligand-binding sensor domain-containing protein/signal transduction histidine kinase